jgi:outer membrane protein assembly factor BamD
VVFLFVGCAGKEVNQDDPTALMEEAESDIASDHYQIAIDKLRMIKNRFPYAKEAATAQLRIGDVFFMQEAYGEASAAYEAFRDLYPKHPKVSYALLRIGKSFESDIPEDPERDMASAARALEAFQEYLNRFPSGAEHKEASQSIVRIRGRQAEKELSIALFYLKRGEREAARKRLVKIEKFFPDTDASRKAREKLSVLKESKGGVSP